MARLSGLQRDVLAEFHKNQGVGKKDFGTIEYLLRKGRRQLETYQDPGIKDLH
ncbi:hypothetical protein SLS61_002547 [Didymella pomorum]